MNAKKQHQRNWFKCKKWCEKFIGAKNQPLPFTHKHTCNTHLYLLVLVLPPPFFISSLIRVIFLICSLFRFKEPLHVIHFLLLHNFVPLLDICFCLDQMYTNGKRFTLYLHLIAFEANTNCTYECSFYLCIYLKLINLFATKMCLRHIPCMRKTSSSATVASHENHVLAFERRVK